MECLYVPELHRETLRCRLPDEEARHARALRLREGDAVLLSNGAGLTACAHVVSGDRREVVVAIDSIVEGEGELPFRLVLALGVLDNRDRMEFAVEKAVELGVTDFIPLRTRYSRPGGVNTERLRSKALAAMKQARRPVLMNVHELLPVEALPEVLGGAVLVLADADGDAWQRLAGDVCVAVGPEGGFSTEELAVLRSVADCRTVRLATRRLRAETAAVLAVGLVALP